MPRNNRLRFHTIHFDPQTRQVTQTLLPSEQEDQERELERELRRQRQRQQRQQPQQQQRQLEREQRWEDEQQHQQQQRQQQQQVQNERRRENRANREPEEIAQQNSTRRGRRAAALLARQHETHYSYEELDEMDNELKCFGAVSDEDKQFVVRKWNEFITARSERVCASCDELVKLGYSKLYTVESLPLEAMKECLKPRRELCADVLAEYDLTTFHTDLSGMLLSKRGVYPADSPVEIPNYEALPAVIEAARQSIGTNPRICICNRCNTHLRSQYHRNRPPKFAIANHFELGPIPDVFTRATYAELRMVSQGTPLCTIKVLTGEGHRPLQSHTTAWFNNVSINP